MKRVEATALLVGHSVKSTLERLYVEAPSPVRIDWCRFTVPLDAIVKRDPSLPIDTCALSVMERSERDVALQARIADCSDYTGAMHVAKSGAALLCELLGVFEVGEVEDKGLDFYTARCALMHEGKTVGLVLAGGKSTAQAGTVHANITGEACLHISHEKWAVVAKWLAEESGVLTRVDASLDVFAGMDMRGVLTKWEDGAFDVRGKRPKENMVGAWATGESRTVTFGKRETGKCVRIYEKGDQLFGAEANDPWVRVECEFRSNHRVIDLEILTSPADYFAGAYPFCESLVLEMQVAAEPVSLRTVADAAVTLLAKTAEAAAAVMTRWVDRTVGASYCALVKHAPEAMLLALYDRNVSRIPKRLKGFSLSQVAAAFVKVAEGLAPSPAPFANGAA